MSADTPAYAATPADLERDRDAILALWRTGLAHHGMPEAKLGWFYERHPEGRPEVVLLETGGTPVGVASVARRRMRLGPRALLAGALVDFVVAPDHRGLFPALFLQRRMRETGLARLEVLFGAPNKNSEAVVRRAGYRHVGDQVRRARVLRSGAYLARYLPRRPSAVLGAIADGARLIAAMARVAMGPKLRFAWLDRPDERFDRLWEAAAGTGELLGVRDRAFLTWRFAENPLRRHRFFVAENRDDGRLAAYAVCHTSDETLHVDDFLCDHRIRGAARSMWLQLARGAYHEGQRSLSVTFMGPRRDNEAIEAAGLIERGRRPVYAAFAGETAGAVASWYLTSADDDT